MILLDDHKRTLKPMSPAEFDRRFAAAAADPTENGLRLMKALLDAPVEAPSDHDTSRLPVGTPSGRVGANPFVVGTPSSRPRMRAFVLALRGGTDPMTRVEFDSTLPKMPKAVERRLRAAMPAASAFEWAGPGCIEGRWTITVLDGSHGRLAQYDLTEEVL